MKRELLSKGPELLADLGDHTADILSSKGGLPNNRAQELARDLVDRMRNNWGGQLVYFPKGDSIDIAERDLELWSKFNGSNHHILAKEYGMSVQAIYKRLCIIRDALIAEKQIDMFGDKTP